MSQIDQIRAIIGDYLDLSDQRSAQMMRLIEAEIAAPADQMVAWQPIETAPKDGTQIIGRATPEEVFACNWFWDDEDQKEGDWLEHGSDVVRPREWLAVPSGDRDKPVSFGATNKEMLTNFGVDRIREGSRMVFGADGQDSWEDYYEVPFHVLDRIRAALASAEVEG